MMSLTRLACATPLLLLASPLPAQSPLPTRPSAAVATETPFADVADLTLAAPVIADGTIRSAARIKGVEAAGVAAGLQRVYVTTDLTALIRGAAGLPPRVGYLLDVATDARGRVPNLKKARVLIFARPVVGSADQLQLVSPNAQLVWTPTADAAARGLARAALAPGAPGAITGIASAFHVPGALPGEGETQVFLQTADARPVSLSVLRRPGERPRWSAALGEIVDEAAAPPDPGTLLWYRLACGLPAALPESSLAQLTPADAAVAGEDYRFVLDSLGPCGRSTAAQPR